MKKTIKLFFYLSSLAIISSCINPFCLTDLNSVTTNIKSTNNQVKAKKLLFEMGEAHGIQFWDSIQTYNVTFADEFYGFFGKKSHPFKEHEIKFSLSYIPNTSNGQLEILTGKQKAVSWGIQSGQTYKKEDEQKILLENNKDMKFWIPTYQYFIEFPSRIQEATALKYIGTKVIDGIKTEGVLASWKTVNPQKDIDQYIIWIDIETKRIVKIEYTVREMYKFVSGAAYFKNYQDYNGLILPSELPVESNLIKDGFLHKMSILDFKINPVDRNTLLPLK